MASWQILLNLTATYSAEQVGITLLDLFIEPRLFLNSVSIHSTQRKETATATQTATETATATQTATETATAMETATATVVPTGTPIGGNLGANFDTISLSIIEDEHVSDVQAELAAERLVQNEELKAFAKHAADVTELHILLMGDLKHRLVDNYTPPPPEFQADYQSPRTFEPK